VNLLILSPSVPKTDNDDKITVGFSFQTDSNNNNKKKFKKNVPGLGFEPGSTVPDS
jgi:hypothetical protein